MSAVRVADCEAGDHANGPPYPIDPAATNGPHIGAFQINADIHAARIARLGFTRADLFSIEPNAKVAKDLHNEKGWQPWTCGWAA